MSNFRFTWLMGYLGDQTGNLRTAFYLVPACYLALAGLVAISGPVKER